METTLNEYEVESNPKAVTASAKKLKVSNEVFDISYEYDYKIKTLKRAFLLFDRHGKQK